jgi:hypothetical protein
MDSFSSFLFADVIGSLDVDRISIIHDAPRLPSTSLLNMNRRAMGMKDFHQPIFSEKGERKEKNRWEVEGLFVRTRSCPDLAVQDPASAMKSARRPSLRSRQCSDSVLLSPRRKPSWDSPTKLLTSEDLEGTRTATRGNMHRWTSSSTSCVKEEGTSPQVNGSAASKSTTRKDRRTLMNRHLLSHSNLSMPTRCPIITPTKKEATSPKGRPERKKTRRYDYSLLQNQRSEDINEGSLRTIDLEADGFTEQSSTQVLEMCSCGSTEFHRLQQGGITATSHAETELKFSTSTSTPMPLTSNFSEEDTGLGDQTKFLAGCNDSLLLLLDAEGARQSRAKNIRGQQSRDALNDHDDALLSRESLSEQTRGSVSVSTP